MRYAIVSDVHSNLEALEAVFAELRDDDRVLCLGDIVGYGPNPNECVELLRKRCEVAIMGNHDLAVIEDFGLRHFNPAARSAVEWTQGVISAGNAEWLSGLDYEYRSRDFMLVHGAPVRYFSYILDVGGARRAFESADAPLIFVGHSHIAEYYALRGADVEHRHMQHGGLLELEEGSRYIVNVGSVGQPRDLSPLASFVLFDGEARTVQWKRVPYDIGAVQERIETAGLPPYLAERLSAGR